MSNQGIERCLRVGALHVWIVGNAAKRAQKKRIGGPGLWIDYELLAKHMQSRPSRLLSTNHSMAAWDTRLLHLADLALGEEDHPPTEMIRNRRKLG